MKVHGKKKYSDEDIGETKIIKDFLPPPNELVLKEESVKVTLSLSKDSLEFFKEMAEQNDVGYQKMIRSLLDRYAAHYHSARKK
jgi:predicted DNA binding CopG/RHH family protein